jgi:hypothetical protein
MLQHTHHFLELNHHFLELNHNSLTHIIHHILHPHNHHTLFHYLDRNQTSLPLNHKRRFEKLLSAFSPSK